MCIGVALWLVTMLLIVQRVLWKQLCLRVYQNTDTDVHDAELYQFRSRRDWFIQSVAKKVPEITQSFDFSRYQALCLDQALMRMREFKVRSLFISLVALSVIGLVDVLCWDFADAWRSVTVLAVTVFFAFSIYFHVHNQEKDMNSIVGADTGHLEVVDDETGSLPMVFVKASIVCSSYMVVRLYSSKVVNVDTGVRTGSSCTPGEEAIIIMLHIIAFIIQCIMQSEIVIISTTLLSMPPRVHGKHIDIAKLVAGMSDRAKQRLPVDHSSPERQLQQFDTYTWAIKPGTEAPQQSVTEAPQQSVKPEQDIDVRQSIYKETENINKSQSDEMPTRPEGPSATGSPVPTETHTTETPTQKNRRFASAGSTFKDALAKRVRKKIEAEVQSGQDTNLAVPVGPDGKVQADDLFRTLAARRQARQARQDNPTVQL